MTKTLALLGGEPAFAAPLHVGTPNVGDRARLFELFEEILDRRWLTNDGQVVRELEHGITRLLGVRHCVAMCNGTVALEVAIRALGLEGEVIVPSFTFVATAHALQWLGIRPVFCDIDPDTHNLDPTLVEALITPRTSAILGVHVWGRPCAVGSLTEIAARHGIPLVFDAAHGFACTGPMGRMIGGFGTCEVFSFHATKFFNTFEGGAVTTEDDELAARLRLMRNFGFLGRDRVVSLGTNAKMNEVCAAMGLTGLDALDGFVARNVENYSGYREGLSRVQGLKLVSYDPRFRNNHQYVVVEVDCETAGVDRDALVRVLEAENVRARRYFFPGVHAVEPYAGLQLDVASRLPATLRLCDRVMTLPTGNAVGAEEVARICEILAGAVAQAPDVMRALRASS